MLNTRVLYSILMPPVLNITTKDDRSDVASIIFVSTTMDEKLHEKCELIEARVKKVEERVTKGEKDLELRLAELDKKCVTVRWKVRYRC